jgi:beta-lactamase class A
MLGTTAAGRSGAIVLSTPMDSLKEQLVALSNISALRAGCFIYDPKNGRYLDMAGHEAFAAASMIKLPVLVALLSAIDRGEIKFSDNLKIRRDLITGGSGSLQWRPADSPVSVRETAQLMMIISDNTATNMIIDCLGGKEKLNDQFKSWGLAETHIQNMLGDFEGTNKTSPYDLVCLLAKVDRGELLSRDSCAWLFDTMQHTRIRTLLNPGLGPGAVLAHKTGDIGSMVGDVGLVTAPTGARYFVSVQVERPFNDRRANALIRVLSRSIYKCFSQDGTTNSPVTALAALPEDFGARVKLSTHRVHTHHRRHHYI